MKTESKKFFANYGFEDMKWKSPPVPKLKHNFAPKGNKICGREWEDIFALCFSVSEIRICTKKKTYSHATP